MTKNREIMRGPSFDAVRVTVLGASGFLGSRLTARLIECGAHVVALSRGAASRMAVPRGVHFVQGDITSDDDVSTACKDAQIVFYMAGRSGASASLVHPREDLETNLVGLIAVLKCLARRVDPPKLVFPSSRLVYGSPARVPVAEDADLVPTSPYGLNKRFSEEYLRLYHRLYAIPYAVARLTNPFGQSPALVWNGYNVINDMIQKALAGGTITIFGDGTQLRDYVYVDDAVEALLMLGALEQNAVTLNVGSGEGISLRDAAQRIVEIAGGGTVAHVPWPDDAKRVETGDFVADIAKARAAGWSPETTFDDGLRRTIEVLR